MKLNMLTGGHMEIMHFVYLTKNVIPTVTVTVNILYKMHKCWCYNNSKIYKLSL